MAVEGNGFIIKDKRSFGEDGELKEEKKENKAGTEEAKREETKTETKTDDTQKTPLPEVNFNSLIFSLSSSALLHLGEIADPNTGGKEKDLPIAKHSIDIIAMLKDKTKGNLDDEEKNFLDSILTDLRLRYVKAVKK